MGLVEVRPDGVVNDRSLRLHPLFASTQLTPAKPRTSSRRNARRASPVRFRWAFAEQHWHRSMPVHGKWILAPDPPTACPPRRSLPAPRERRRVRGPVPRRRLEPAGDLARRRGVLAVRGATLEHPLDALGHDPAGWAEIGGEAFAPGYFVWNSEVGKRSVGIRTLWFQKVCANHIVWDAVEAIDFARKHTARVSTALDDIRRHVEALVAKRDERRDGFAAVIEKAMRE